VLGLPYSQAVDMWSFGCIMAELATGKPLLPAQDENELVEFYRLIFGDIPTHMIEEARKKKQFFDKNGKIIRSKRSRLRRVKAQSLQLE
jgi:dual specificity tyrosine-phosphorylation-regulated kinase 2/3/4